MDDNTLFALCVWTEARGEPYEGKCAVARVIHNRMTQRYFSDGTVAGTVLAKDQFSAFYFDMVGGHYTRVCSTPEEAEARAEHMLPEAEADPTWSDCNRAVTDGAAGSGYTGGPVWDRFAAEPRALLYCNMDVSQPAWATPSARICAIYSHTFFRG